MEELGLLHLTHRPITELLELAKWAEDFTTTQLEQLALFFTPYSAETGLTLIREGLRCSFICLICEGEVDVIKESSIGRSKKLQSFGPGKVLGEMSFFDHAPASATIVVKKEAVLLLMTEENYKSLCEQQPHLALVITIKLIRTVSQRLRQTSGKLIDLI